MGERIYDKNMIVSIIHVGIAKSVLACQFVPPIASTFLYLSAWFLSRRIKFFHRRFLLLMIVHASLLLFRLELFLILHQISKGTNKSRANPLATVRLPAFDRNSNRAVFISKPDLFLKIYSADGYFLSPNPYFNLTER